MRAAAALAVLALALAAASSSGGRGVFGARVRAELSPASARVGDKVALTISVEGAPDGAVIEWPEVGKTIGDLEVEPAEAGALSRGYRLRSFVPGDHLVPKLEVKVSSPGDGKRLVLETEDLVLALEGLVEEGTTKPRGARGTVPVPGPFRAEYVVLPAAVLALAGLALYAARRRSRAGEARPAPLPARKPLPPEVVALRALDALEEMGLVDRGRVPEHFYRLSGIVRRYIEARFAIAAPEMTSEEFLDATARSDALPGGHRETLREFMRVSDLAKYARFVPGRDEVAETLAVARRFVRETTPAATALPEREMAGAERLT